MDFKKVLFIKLSSIGDVVHLIPALESFKMNYPETKLSWVVEEESSDILIGYPLIDRLYIIKREWIDKLKNPLTFFEGVKIFYNFFRLLKNENFDVVIDFQGLFKSGIVTFFTGAKRRIGYDKTRELSYIFLNEKISPYDPNRHAIERYINLIKCLGVKNGVIRWDFNIDDDIKNMRETLHLHGIKENDKIISINPIARWETKLWNMNRFGRLSDLIVGKLGAKVIFTGSKKDRTKIEEAVSKTRYKPLIMAGKTSLRELTAIIRISDLFISTDTGPMHIAAALKTPVIALFGPTSPLRTGPYGDNNIVIRRSIDCSPCFKKICKDPICMKEITVEEVFDAVRSKINK
jgi:3-deoxy-D-manno-octulosonic-acid transferase/heptosyltransferase-1